ncbi:MAG: hypothetical protein JNJ83_13625 [Verrucomicrobiaceae bacterium]|nr:hypothetical protein [Verrucomicrobiaceae bacterium]
MRTLTYYLENPFDAPSISMAELLAFSTDHLQRMTANNSGGELSARITATSQALVVVEDCVTDDQGKLGLRKARKQAKDNLRTTLPAAVAKLVAAVVAQYGDGSPEVTECVPQGRTIFSTCRDDQVAPNLQTLVNGITAHQATLGAPLVAAATNLLNAWTAVYSASESSTGAKTTSQEGKRLARENLQLMLFLNLLKLAEMFPRQPEKLALYMQQHLLENPSSEEEEEEPTPEPPAPPPTP